MTCFVCCSFKVDVIGSEYAILFFFFPAIVMDIMHLTLHST